MNEIREELEKQYAASVAKQQSPKVLQKQDDSTEETTVVAVSTPDSGCIAPKSYRKKFAEDFKNLSPDWQQFLSEREKQIEKGFSEFSNKLNGYKWVDEIYKQNQPRLDEYGIFKVNEWLENLAFIDAEMSKNPTRTIRAIAKVYGVKLEAPKSAESRIPSELLARIGKLEDNYHEMVNCLHREQQHKLAEMVYMYGKQTDETGNLLHPYFATLERQIMTLLQNGMADNVADAYEQAMWLNHSTREDLINKQINNKAAEAQKAKEASFSAKSKVAAPQRELTLREELEKNMAALLK